MNEKKIEDLLRRLVAMSPEPPPYPEEIQVTNEPVRRSPSPMLVFAGAVAAVAALAVPLLLVFRGGPPEVVASTTTTQAVSSTSPLVTTTLPGDTTTVPPTSTTVATPSVWTGTVFLYQTPENSFLGNPALVPIHLEVSDPSGALNSGASFTEALGLLGDELPFENSIPTEVRVLSLTAGTDSAGAEVLIADMNQAFTGGAGGLLADITMLNQLVYTLTFETEFDRVLFTADGSTIEAYGSEGIDLTEPVGRDDYLDDMAVIFLTDPISRVEDVFVVSGMANTFEATLNVIVLDEAGEPIDEQFTTATCGSGCWGTFEVEVAADLVRPGTSSIQLLTYSANDGRPENVLTVRIPSDIVWRLTLNR